MFNFSQAINEPTHECGNTLDWVMFRPADNVLCSSSVSQSIDSDHFWVVCELCFAVPPDPAVYRESCNICALDIAAFHADLWVLVFLEVCLSFDHFSSTPQSLLEKPTAWRSVLRRPS